MSPQPSPLQPDLTGLIGDHVASGWTRPRVVGFIAGCLAEVMLVLMAVALRDKALTALALAALVLTALAGWRRGARTVTTTISAGGITLDRGSGPLGRVHLSWGEVREVYVAGTWQAYSSVRTASNQEFALPGLDRAQAAQLAQAVRSSR